MERLPRQVIHNDGHAGNLLRADAGSEHVTGLIDFGDLVHTVTVADLAVSGASLVPHQADPERGAGGARRRLHARRAARRGGGGEAIPDLVPPGWC